MRQAPRCSAALLFALASCAAPHGDGSATGSSVQSIGCTLTPAELSARRQQLLPGLIERADEVTDLENGLRLRFTTRPGVLAELTRIIEQERTCCSFLRFQLTTEPGTGPIVFEVTGPPGTREMLRTL